MTNTGYYGGADDKFVPVHAYTESAEQLATRWTQEWKHGMEKTDVKPGFIKIGVDTVAEGAQLSAIDAKLVRAAAQTSRATGLAKTCHTQNGVGALAAAQLFIREGGGAKRFIVAHSDGHGSDWNKRIADLGVWISFDGIGSRTLPEHLQMILPMRKSHANQLLLSQDRGWWNAGEPKGGRILDYNYLPDTFLPALRKAGLNQGAISQLIVENPARAFGV